MPIDIIAPVTPLAAATTQALADALAAIFGSKPRGTWVTLRAVPATHYAENGGLLPGDAPVFARILQRDPPQGDALRAEIRAVTATIAKLLARPERNVHVIYEPSARGRVAFGGTLVE